MKPPLQKMNSRPCNRNLPYGPAMQSYQGIAKNISRIIALFGFSRLWRARHQTRPGKFIFPLLLLLCFFCEDIMAQGKAGNPQNVLASIQGENTIEKIEIFYIPTDVITRTNITPKMLEANYFYKLTIQIRIGNFYLQGLKQALQDTKVEKSDRESDLRWGILLLGPKNRRIATIYIDRLESQGYINSIPVNFTATEPNKGVLQWLKGNFSSVFFR
jgi:hypothetical protein